MADRACAFDLRSSRYIYPRYLPLDSRLGLARELQPPVAYSLTPAGRNLAFLRHQSAIFAGMVSAVHFCCRVRVFVSLVSPAAAVQSCDLPALTRSRMAIYSGVDSKPLGCAIMKPVLLHVSAIVLSLAGGVLVSLAFPPWNQDWLVWIGFTPVLAGLLLFPRGWVASIIRGAVFGGTFGGMVFSWLLAGGLIGDWMWNFLSLALLGGIWGAFVGLFVQLPSKDVHPQVSPILPGYGFNSTAWIKSISHLRAALITAAAWTFLEWGQGGDSSGMERGWHGSSGEPAVVSDGKNHRCQRAIVFRDLRQHYCARRGSPDCP